MISKNNKLRLEDIDSKLYTKDDINGYSIYYLDKDFTKPFTGEIYVKFKNKIESETEYKNGYKNGLEYIYYSNGIIEQINECRANVIYGVSKEFDEVGNLKTASIVYNNNHIKVLELNDNKIKEVIYEIDDKNFPQYLKQLLKMSNKELIDYQFQTDNPNLNF